MRMIQGKIGDDGVVQTALRMPVSLRDDLRAEANRLGRSMNTHVVMILKEAAGNELAGTPPAAENNEAALQGGPSITNGYKETEDECSHR